MKICLKMTGCKNNRYELDQILRWAIDNKVAIVPVEEADYCIINTCTVTHVADRKSRQLVRKLKTRNPKLKMIVFGCAARMQKEEFEQIAEIDHLLADLPAVIGFLENINFHCRNAINRVSAMEMRSRALTQIQDGCDNYCAYCIIVAARGKSKNRPIDDIIDEIRQHHKNGFNEVVLTGINIGAYGASSTTKPEESLFTDLLQTIISNTDIPQIRISSLGPEYFFQDSGFSNQDSAKAHPNNKLFQILKNPRIARHIHLSIQSGSDSVLERMKRHYSVKDVENVIKRLKADIPGIAITTDIIAGFPEESDKESEETMEFVRQNPLAKAHVFPYSIRKNTLAEKMEQVPDEIKKDRAKKLQELADHQRREFISNQIGTDVKIIWETENEGLTDNYIRVQQNSDHPARSLTVEVLTEEMIKRG